MTPEEERQRLERGIPPAWASAWGEDEYGAYVCFRVGQAEQRMRWIEAGTFVMGSPETEDGRYDHEGPQHEVKLTHGYWMADTPCTQELWVAVMGTNPSEFQSPRRPVEQVSWDDVSEFLRRLEQCVPGLHAGLPTEAQWEYACRAGTTTATYAGDLEILGDNNAPVLDAIAWYGGNSGVGYELEHGWGSKSWPGKQYEHERAGTREVGQKRPNAWGLYDMLGNVWEWCADLRRDYAAQQQQQQQQQHTDPVGTRGGFRVNRGGSWVSYARRVRAADRIWYEPGYRYVYLGFRLIRGQAAAPSNSQQA